MTLLAIAGSIRSDSANAALVRAITELGGTDIQFDLYEDLATLPYFSSDIDTDAPPEAVVDLRRRIRSADGVLICTPEYAYGMPGILKNALDWLVSSGELYRKPVVALSASPSPEGGARALSWLRQTLAALGAIVEEEATFSVGLVKQKLEGARIKDQETVEQVQEALRSMLRKKEAV